MRRLVITGVALVWLAVAGPAFAGQKPTLEPTASAQALAKAAVLGPDDMPAGWRTDPRWTPGSTPLDLFGPLCRGVDPDLSDATLSGWRDSRLVLVSGRQVQSVGNLVLVFAKTPQAHAMVDRWALPWGTTCLAAGTKDGTARIASARRFRPSVAAGAEAHGFRVVSTDSTMPGERLYIDAVFVRVGSRVSFFLLIRNSKPIDAFLEGRLVRLVSSRLA